MATNYLHLHSHVHVVESSLTTDAWAQPPLAPGLLDFDLFELDMCEKRPLVAPLSAPLPRTTYSKEWPQYDHAFAYSPDEEHIEDIALRTPPPPRTVPLVDFAPSPESDSSLLRAPRLRTRPLLSSPCSFEDKYKVVDVPLDGTRPPAHHRYSALGLDFSTACTSTQQLPSPPPSPVAGRGRRRRLTDSSDTERGRPVERDAGRRCRRDSRPRRVEPSLSPEVELHNRVADWSCAVAAATSVPAPPSPIRPGFVRALSLETVPQTASAQLAPWAQRIGAARGAGARRDISMPGRHLTR